MLRYFMRIVPVLGKVPLDEQGLDARDPGKQFPKLLAGRLIFSRFAHRA
jgi:hypothetical protein